VECDRQPPIRRLLDRQLVVPSPNVLRQQLRWVAFAADPGAGGDAGHGCDV